MKAKLPPILMIFGLICIGLAAFSMVGDSIAVYNEYVYREQQRLAVEAGHVGFAIYGSYYSGYVLRLAVIVLSILSFLSLRKSSPILATILSGVPFFVCVFAIFNSWIAFTLIPGDIGDVSFGELLFRVFLSVEGIFFAALFVLFLWQVVLLYHSRFTRSSKTTALP